MEEKELISHFFAVVNHLDGFAIIDRNGYYLYVNESWSNAMGYRLDDLNKLNAKDVFPDSLSCLAMETGQQIVGHPVKWGKDRIPGFTNYYPFFLEDGSVGGCYCLVTLSGIENAHILQNRIVELSAEIDFLRKELTQNNNALYGIDQLLGSSPKMKELKDRIRKVARTNSSVLIEGETGTGKELVAHAIHLLSKRANENFVRVNCSAIPPDLMESEFFGYRKGAFTGADSRGKIGKFQFADRGTIFLDEINSLPLYIQPKFLRVLQEREIEPIGSNATIPVNIRVISASNKSLEQQVADGTFRQDLFYRLDVVRISVPPLRERREDIPELVDGLIKRLNKTLGTYIQSITPRAMKLLMQYDWPGNVRELQNAIESAISMADSPVLRVEDFFELDNRIRTKEYKKLLSGNPYNLQSAKAEFEKHLIKEVLELYGGNHTRAADVLGISRTMLYKKLSQYNIAQM